MDEDKELPCGESYVFEIAWEVANKVGGIYTVLRSKSAASVNQMGDSYCLIGIYNEESARIEVEILDISKARPELRVCVEKMLCMGMKVVYGRWLVEGYPQVILLGLDSVVGRLQEWRDWLWRSAHIGIHHQDIELNGTLMFGALTSIFLENFYLSLLDLGIDSPKIICHFHEWLSGCGLIFTRTKRFPCAVVFTTHATLLGRHLCSGNTDFYNNLTTFNLDHEAGVRGIYARYSIERAAANLAHTFTTVSDITSLECEHLLKRKPDFITPNGLSVTRFVASHESQNLHLTSKIKINKFVQGHFYGHIDFNFDELLYFFISGRYEFCNKGVDLFIEALARLNYLLQMEKSTVTVLAFFIMPAKVNNYNVESMRGQAIVKHMRDTVRSIADEIGHNILEKCSRSQVPNPTELLGTDSLVKLKRCIYSLQREQLPPICTHNMLNDDDDPILSHLRRVRLFNHREDRVKVVFHPEFLSPNSPLLPMEYEEFVRGCHLGVFPSYYEPWGYTPAECTVLGIPSITTNLSGFGCFTQNKINSTEAYGIHIVDRRHKSVEESVQQLTDFMFKFAKSTRRYRIIQRNRTERLAELFDWDSMHQYYEQARRDAMYKVFQHTYRRSESIPALVNETERTTSDHCLVLPPRSLSEGPDTRQSQSNLLLVREKNKTPDTPAPLAAQRKMCTPS